MRLLLLLAVFVVVSTSALADVYVIWDPTTTHCKAVSALPSAPPPPLQPSVVIATIPDGPTAQGDAAALISIATACKSH